MTIEERLTRCRVYVPAGVSIEAAVTRHRELTGHGGMCMIILVPPMKRKRGRDTVVNELSA
jgi:hypothetical protein